MPLVALIASASQSVALTIAQQSNQSVRDGSPVTACVDVAYGKTANGTSVGPFPCNNQLNEQWVYQNGQFLGIDSNRSAVGGANRCLSVSGNSTATGAPTVLSKCVAGNTSQLWEITGDGNTSFIVNLASGKCLDSEGQLGSNLHLVINPCNGSANQTWLLK
ncbi:MAG TPA: RICIN domain-containing protein [Stellaceae bacterium]|nr:RICIN domain-containing protein [Stellaceae bacterium]